MLKKIGPLFALLGLFGCVVALSFSQYFDKTLFIGLISLSLAMTFLGISLFIIQSKNSNLKKYKAVFLTISIVLLVLSILSSIIKWKGVNIEGVLAVFFYCFAYAPLELYLKNAKWRAYSNNKWEMLLLSSLDFVGINLILLGVLSRILHWPGQYSLIYIGSSILIVGLFLWSTRFKQEVIRRKNSEDMIKMQYQQIAQQKADIENVNQELQERNKYLAELNAEKNEFMGIAAHDLKNPLTAIMLTTEITGLYWKNLSEKDIKNNISSIYTTAQRMKAIITNLLDTHAIESGAVRLHNSQFSLTETLAAEVESYRDRANAKNIQIHINLPASDIQIITDKEIWHEIMDNLISNAVKYSPHGKNVYINGIQSSNQGKDIVRIEIKDEGQGVSEEDQKKMFGKFQRLTAKPTGGEHSTGLGLSIVKKLVEMMGGRVWCESEGAGKGAVFVVEIPMNITKAEV